VFGISEKEHQRRHKKRGIQECGKESCHSAGKIDICPFFHSAENIAQKQSVQNTGQESLKKGKYRVDTEKHGPHRACSAYAYALKKACKSENGSCSSSSRRAQHDRADRHRDHIESDRQRSDIQIPKRRIGHQKKHSGHKAKYRKLRCCKFRFHVFSSLLSFP